MMVALRCVLFGLFSSSVSVTAAFSPSSGSRSALAHPRLKREIWAVLRGGQQASEDALLKSESEIEYQETEDAAAPEARKIAKFAMLMPSLTAIGTLYSQHLERRPIITKSITAGAIFGLSDYLAQKVERSNKNDALNWTRTMGSMLVGLLYFGPAAHYWYEMIFRLLPETGLLSTLQKAFWGQIIFGPSFTCIFFAVSLMQSGAFSLGNWWSKIRKDLPVAWLAGAGYWPLVDLVSYSVVPVKWIPLFVNFCSLIWTIYLSLVANRSTAKAAQ